MRDVMLAAIRRNRPDPLPHPGTATPRAVEANAESRFSASAGLSMSKVIPLGAGESLGEVLTALHPDALRVTHRLTGGLADDLASAPSWKNVAEVDEHTTIAHLAEIQLAVLPAQLGVIENGACWLGERDMGHRALPFSTEHLVMVVPRSQLVETMHEAYAQLACDGAFGVFIAGPSKTADIEQSLVIGAQGPRSLAVVLV